MIRVWRGGCSLRATYWGGRTRTSNFPVNSRAVCQLTYTPNTRRRDAAPRSVLQPRLFRKALNRFLLLGAELLGQRHVGFYVHVPTPPVFLDAVPGDPKLLAMLSARRNAEHDTLVVQRLDLYPGAEHSLREIDRDDADEVQSLAPEEAIRRDMDLDDEIAATLWPLILEAQARAFFDARRDFDVDSLLDADLAAALTGGTALRRNGALAAAHRTGTIHGEPALAERDRPSSFAFGARVDGRTLRRPGPTARRANLGHHECDRHRPAQRGDTKRNRDLCLDFFGLRFAPPPPPPPPPPARPAPPEDGREDVPQTAEVGDVEIAAVWRSATATPCAGSAATTAPKAAGASKRAVATELIVFLALVGVAQDVVRFVDFLETVGGLRSVR